MNKPRQIKKLVEAGHVDSYIKTGNRSIKNLKDDTIINSKSKSSRKISEAISLNSKTRKSHSVALEKKRSQPHLKNIIKVKPEMYIILFIMGVL